MNSSFLPGVECSRRKPLAICLSSMFVLAAPTATLTATVLTVTSCLDDGGEGTLRSIVSGATPVDIVDFAGLDCSATSNKITLSAGYIPIYANSLTIDGGGAAHPLTIDASNLPHAVGSDSRVFTHVGLGTLYIYDLTLTGGYVGHSLVPSYGGCLSSPGNVVLTSVTVTECSAFSSGFSMASGARGGGIHVHGNLSLRKSTISHNTAITTGGGGIAAGGGAYVGGNLTIDPSGSIGYNAASGYSFALGGGVFVRGNLTISGGTGEYFAAFYANSAACTGTYDGPAKGGGAYTYGSFSANTQSRVLNNSVSAPNTYAYGGGLYTKGGLSLMKSFVTGNTADGYRSLGAGVFSTGDSSISYTSIGYNKAYRRGRGGGLALAGASNTIVASTVSGNTSDGSVGGVDVAGVLFELKNSTISNNHANGSIGGLYARPATVRLFNSTIAFNSAGSAGAGSSPGVVLSANYQAVAANLQSMLISNNSYGSSVQYDFSTRPTPSSVTFNGGALLVPANNLVRVTFVTNLPKDTKQGVCPLLGPLRDNGGLTFTHAPMSTSPAIDTGNSGSLLVAYDQRGSAAVNGTMDYARVSGASALADIGAYEVQQNDIVFNVGFEGCLP